MFAHRKEVEEESLTVIEIAIYIWIAAMLIIALLKGK